MKEGKKNKWRKGKKISEGREKISEGGRKREKGGKGGKKGEKGEKKRERREKKKGKVREEKQKKETISLLHKTFFNFLAHFLQDNLYTDLVCRIQN